MDVFEAIYTSRALRRFKPDPVPEDVVFQLIDAAIRAPTGHNSQDWRFIVVTDAGAKSKMQEWSERAWAIAFPAYQEQSAIDALPRTQRLSIQSVKDLAHSLASVPLIVVVCGLRGKHSSPGGSHFPAVQNMLLAARALGLGATLTTRHLFYEKETEAALGLPPGVHSYAILPIGYPEGKFGPVGRGALADIVYAERWGQPYRSL